VLYPIRRLERFREVVPLVTALEDVAIATCASFGVRAERWSEHRGVWVGTDQIAAIGLSVKQMTSMHGLSLNADSSETVDFLVPCGVPNRALTSISTQVGLHVSVTTATNALIRAAAAQFEISLSSAITY